jgi:hypothetical protein
MGQTPSTQMQKFNDISQQSIKRVADSSRANLDRIQSKGQAMGQTALQNIQNSGNIQGALQRGQTMGQTALQKIQNSNFIQGLNAKMQGKMNNIIQQINENIQMMKDDLKVETITDLAKILIKSEKDEWVNVGNFLIKKVDSIRKENIRKENILLTGGGKKYKSKKHNRTKKHKKSKKHNRTKKHKKSKKHNRTKKKR